MSESSIHVSGLGKQYEVGALRERYTTLRDSLTRGATQIFSRAKRPKKSTVWALRDVSFDVHDGEVLGVIGRNGAGKSTLLKVLSRITHPSAGYAELRGRVGSLLEVGTGFHPELTGRENVYLSGAILGMSRSEIDRHFEEIVDYAGVRKFIDTPVKHYSSGMYLRLAFGVAAHLEPEILLVDEVLAVGDAEFQKKCLGKMRSVAQSGRTVLLVSHNMEAILSLCSRCLVIDAGTLDFDGDPLEAVRRYNGIAGISAGAKDGARFHVETEEPTAIVRVDLLDASGEVVGDIATWEDWSLRVEVQCAEDYPHGGLVIDILDARSQRMIVFDSGNHTPLKQGRNVLVCHAERMPLSAGEFFLGGGVAAGRGHWLWRSSQLGTFSVTSADLLDLGRPPTYARMACVVPQTWVREA